MNASVFIASVSLLIVADTALAETAAVKFNGLPSWVKGEPETITLKQTAPPSYIHIQQTVTLIRPQPLKTAAELDKLNPGLLKTLPGLTALMVSSEASPLFTTLYDTKLSAIKGGNMMPNHSYFDTATVVHLKNSTNGRRAVLFQSDMDVDTDGSDPVRMDQLKQYDDARFSRTFQPLLSYSWAKSPEQQAATSPFIAYYKDTLTKLRELKTTVDTHAANDIGPIWPELQTNIQTHIDAVTRKATYYASDLKHRRSLIASTDPFIVIPQTWIGTMQVGDYVAVVHGGKVYPCLIGDTGPTTKSGEGSQHLAKALNPKASGRNSAVTTPGVTYLVFPGTSAGRAVPDLAKYRAEVSRLLLELFGAVEDTVIHTWK
jgi:hypothetical protein